MGEKSLIYSREKFGRDGMPKPYVRKGFIVLLNKGFCTKTPLKFLYGF
jgi:hypothetical protein